MFPASEYKAQFPGSMMARQPCNFGNRFVEFWVYKLTFAGEISTIRTWEITKPSNGKPVTCLSRLWYGCKGAPTALPCRRCSSSYLKIGKTRIGDVSSKLGRQTQFRTALFPLQLRILWEVAALASVLAIPPPPPPPRFSWEISLCNFSESATFGGK